MEPAPTASFMDRSRTIVQGTTRSSRERQRSDWKDVVDMGMVRYGHCRRNGITSENYERQIHPTQLLTGY